MSNISKHFFLLSFLPAIAYWYLDAYYPVKIAVAGGLILACLELALEKFFSGNTHALSRFNFFLIVFLGGLSILASDGIWFRLQPAFTGNILGGYLLVKLKQGKGLLMEMAEGMNRVIEPAHLFDKIEQHLAIFLIGYGWLMVVIAIFFDNDVWLFFKTGGFYFLMFVFFVFEMVWMRWAIKRYRENQLKRMILSRF